MKKLILSLTLLFIGLVFLYAWQPGTVAHWSGNNTRDDTIAGYKLTPSGTGAQFLAVGTVVLNTTPPNGAGYYLANRNGGRELINPIPIATIGASNYWTIEARLWLPAKGPNTPGTSKAAYFYNSGGSGHYFHYFIMTDWNPWGTNMQLALGSDAFFYGTYDTTYASIGGTADAWNRFTTTFNAGTYKFYVNGSLRWTSSAGKPNAFATPGDFYTNQMPDYGGYYGMGMSGIIIVPTDTGGVELLDATYTFTSTPTNTPTNTPTITYTNTPTITPSFTPTITQTPVPYDIVPTPEVFITLQQYAITDDMVVIRWNNAKWTSEYTLLVNGVERKLFFPYDQNNQPQWWYYRVPRGSALLIRSIKGSRYIESNVLVVP